MGRSRLSLLGVSSKGWCVNPDRCGDRNMTVRFRKRKLDRDDGMSRQSFPAVRMKKRITPNLCVQVRIGSQLLPAWPAPAGILCRKLFES